MATLFLPHQLLVLLLVLGSPGACYKKSFHKPPASGTADDNDLNCGRFVFKEVVTYREYCSARMAFMVLGVS